MTETGLGFWGEWSICRMAGDTLFYRIYLYNILFLCNKHVTLVKKKKKKKKKKNLKDKKKILAVAIAINTLLIGTISRGK